MPRAVANWLFVLAMVLTGIYLSDARWMLGTPASDIWFDIAGGVISAAGVLIRVVSRDWKIAWGDEGLVTTGPYAMLRHPLYVGSLLAGLGVFIVFGSAALIVVFFVGFLLVHIPLARREERDLVRVWPREYPGYMKAVPGWIPRPGSVVLCYRDCSGRVNLTSVRTEISSICGIFVAALLLDLWAASLRGLEPFSQISGWIKLGLVAAAVAAWFGLRRARPVDELQ